MPTGGSSGRRRDRYRSFGALSSAETEGFDFRREHSLRSTPVAVVAIHGGSIEPGTAEVAKAIAGDDLSWYCFEGIKPRGNGILHVASTRFDDPLCVDLVSRSDMVVAVHGNLEGDPRVVVSGLAEDLVRRLIEALQGSGFHADLDDGAYAGAHPRNICNRGRLGKGVQMELSRSLRRMLFAGLSRRDRRVFMPPFHALVTTIRLVIAPCAGELVVAGTDPGGQGRSPPRMRDR